MAVSTYFDKLFKKQPNYFAHIEGLRAFHAIRVMLHHICLFGALFYTPTQYLEMLKHPLFKWTGSTFFMIDTFFVISGLVIGYSLIKEYKDRGKVDVIGFFMRRCARVYPLYLAVLAFSIPLFYDSFPSIWMNLLQINNLLPMNQQFISWVWALAVDFQFYVLFGVFMALLSKNIIGKKITLFVCIALFFMPFVITPFIIAAYHYPYYSINAFVITTAESHYYIGMGFDKIHVHISAIFYGLLTAYALVYHKEKIETTLAQTPKVVINIASLALLGMIFFVLANDPMMYVGKAQNVWQTSTFWGIVGQRNIYSLALCSLLLLAHAPKGMVMKTFVKIFGSVVLRPFGRISYCTYLIHPLMILGGYFIFFATHQAVTAEAYFLQGLKLILYTYILAIPVYFFIEQPGMRKMRQLLIQLRSKKSIFVAPKDKEEVEQSAAG